MDLLDVMKPLFDFLYKFFAGMRFNSTLSGCGQLGYYWSSTFLSAYDSFAYYMSLNSGNLDYGYGNRYYGYPVRAVYIGD